MNAHSQFSWTEVQTPITTTISKVQFINEHVGWAYSVGGKILKSEDEGLSWEVVFDDPTKSFWSMHWSDLNHGWLSGQGTFIRTQDGGQTWEDMTFGDVTNEFDAVYFVDSLVGYMGLYTTTPSFTFDVYRTTDGGDNWINTNYNFIMEIRALFE